MKIIYRNKAKNIRQHDYISESWNFVCNSIIQIWNLYYVLLFFIKEKKAYCLINKFVFHATTSNENSPLLKMFQLKYHNYTLTLGYINEYFIQIL